MDNNGKVSAVTIGDLKLTFDSNRTLILKDCLYVSNIRRNLVSISSLVHFGSVYFNDSVVIIHNKHFIYSASLVDNLYIINLVSSMLQLNEMNSTTSLSSKRKELSKMNHIFGT